MATDARAPAGAAQAPPAPTAAQPERNAVERADAPDMKAVPSPDGSAVQPAAVPAPPVQAAARAPEAPSGGADPLGGASPAASIPPEHTPATEPSPTDSPSAHPVDPQAGISAPASGVPSTGETTEQRLARVEGALASVERAVEPGANRHDRAPLPVEHRSIARQPALLLE